MTEHVHPDELRRWIREHTPRLLAVARAFASEDTDAEDLLQEVWWRASQHARARAAGTPLGAWLVAVTVNVGRDHLRRRRRRERLMAFWGAPRVQLVEPASPHHDGTALWRAVAELPALQRDVLLLRVVEDCSTAECAHLLGRAEGTVKASLARALARLRGRFDEEATWIPRPTATPAK